MKANYSFFIGLVFALFTPYSVAQVPIAPGVYACDGAAQAGPCNGGGSGGTNSSSSSPYGVVGYAHAAPKWADRWGAIASGSNEGTGVSVRAASKRKAEQIALFDCRNRGGIDCRILSAYKNQCAAMAASTQLSTTYRAGTEEKAKVSALKECEQKAGSGKCWVYYSGCSYPEQIQ